MMVESQKLSWEHIFLCNLWIWWWKRNWKDMSWVLKNWSSFGVLDNIFKCWGTLEYVPKFSFSCIFYFTKKWFINATLMEMYCGVDESCSSIDASYILHFILFSFTINAMLTMLHCDVDEPYSDVDKIFQ